MATFSNYGTPTVSSGALLNTDTLTFVNTTTDHSVDIRSTDKITLQMDTPSTDAWFSFNIYRQATAQATNPIVQCINTNGDVLVSVGIPAPAFSVDKNTINVLSTGVLTPYTNALFLPPYTVLSLDIHVITDPGSVQTGLVEVYLDGVLVFNATNLDNSTFPVDRMELNCSNLTDISVNHSICYSNFLVGEDAMSPTVNVKTTYFRFDGDGSTTDWTGDFNNFDEGASAPNGNVVTTNTSNTRHQFTLPSQTVLNNRIIGVGMSSYAFGDGNSPTTYRHYVNIAATNYDGAANITTVTPGVYKELLTTSPATTLEWNMTEINSAQWGLKSD